MSIFCLSFDLEMAWGLRETMISQNPKSVEKMSWIMKVPEIVDRLLTICDIYNIKATWATVGALFGGTEIIKEMGKVLGVSLEGYNLSNKPPLYQPEMIKKIVDAGHEIGCHSYFHSDFSKISREHAEWEIMSWYYLAKKFGIKTKTLSFVYPQGKFGHFDVLKEQKIKVLREDVFWFSKLGIWRKPFAFIDRFFAMTPIIRDLYFEEGILIVPVNYFFTPLYGIRGAIPMRKRVKQGKKGIDEAIRNDGLFHFFAHPHNFGYKTDEMMDGLIEILEYAKEKGIKTKTMEEIYHESVGDKNIPGRR